MPRLIIREGGRERVVELDLDKITIGRSKANAISILDEKASRAHCALERTELGWFVVDLGSSNGTLLNGKLVKKQLVTLGDVITIGATEIHFERVIEEKSAPPPAGADSGHGAGPEQPAQVEAEIEAEIEEVEAVPVAESKPAKAPRKRVEPPRPKDVSLHAIHGGARFFLKVVKGPSEGTTYPVGSLPFTIGRRATNTISLDDERASGSHAQITREGSLWVLTDLGSTNGTLMGGRKIRREILEHGVSFTIGKTTFQFMDLQGPELAQVAHEERPKPAEPKDLPSDADFVQIDVQRALKRTSHDSLLTLLYTIAGLFLIVSVAYFAFHVFGGLWSSTGAGAKKGSLIVENWSFEEGPGESGGVLPGWITPTAGWAVDQRHAKSGKSSLRLDCALNNEPDEAILVGPEGLERRPITPDRQYQVKVQVKLDQARKAGVRVLWSDPLKPYFVEEEYSELLGADAGAWRTLRWTFTPPREARRMALSLCAFGNTGSVWFDDVELYESEIDPEARKSQTVTLGNQIEIVVDPRGRWSLYRLGVTTLWDAQMFLADSKGKASAFSRQVLSGIDRRAFVSGNSMRYLGQIYHIHDAEWKPLMQEIYSGQEQLTVRMKLSGNFAQGTTVGVTLSTRPDTFASAGVQITTAAGVRFWKGDSDVHGVVEMVWGSGDNPTSFSFPRENPVDIALKRGKHEVRVTLSRQLNAVKDAEFVINFSGMSLSQEQKRESVISRIRGLCETGKLQEAISLARESRRETILPPQTKKRLDRLIKEITDKGEALLKDTQGVYEDFKRSPHPELLRSFGKSVDALRLAFPGTDKERDANSMLEHARAQLEKESSAQEERDASRMLLTAKSYRQKGMLGLAAVYFEYVRDSFPGTEWEKDARTGLEMVKSQSRIERRW